MNHLLELLQDIKAYLEKNRETWDVERDHLLARIEVEIERMKK